MYQLPYPRWLENVDLARVIFYLEITEDFYLPAGALFQLRRELLAACAELESGGRLDISTPLKPLLTPELSSDPVVQRQVQKPSPALVLSPDTHIQGSVQAGEVIPLPVLLVGAGIVALDALVELLKLVGKRGMYNGQGHFVIKRMEGLGAGGESSPLDLAVTPVTPLIVPCSWWLDVQPPPIDRFRLRFVSPVRLIRNKSPLFRAGFPELFPFVLRRVGSILVSHGQVEMPLAQRSLLDHDTLLDLSSHIRVTENTLRWQDWRVLEQDRGEQKIGGLVGDLVITGAALEELAWILCLGELFQVGKGAAFGCGRYQILSE